MTPTSLSPIFVLLATFVFLSSSSSASPATLSLSPTSPSSSPGNKLTNILQDLGHECFHLKHGLDLKLLKLREIEIGLIIPNSNFFEVTLKNVTIRGLHDYKIWRSNKPDVADMSVASALVTAKYFVLGKIAGSLPVNQVGDLEITFENIVLSLGVDKLDKMLTLNDVNYGSARFCATNGISRSNDPDDTEFTRVIFWKLWTSIGDQFDKILNMCSKDAVVKLNCDKN